MKKQILVVASVAIFIFSCGDMKESINKTTESSEKKIEEKKEKVRTKIEIKEFYAWVDKLRVRSVPGLKSKKQGAKFVDVLDEGEKVIFLGEKSSETFEVKLRGRTMNAPFYKVRTKNDKIGWIFAGALSSFPIDVEHYRVAIFFDITNEENDFFHYSSQAINELLGTGVESLQIDDDFDEIDIRNNRGEIIGVENIRKLVKKHEIGVVCVEKGRSQKYVDYSMDMGFEILDVYGLLVYH
ncbi:MAG: SH3 domain-containing protein [Flavobacteriales bacterium]